MSTQDTRLLRVLKLLYHQHDADEQALADMLLAQRKAAWQTALRDEAQAFGYTGPAQPPRREDLAELRRMSQEDARSIVNTWNRDVDRQLERLYAQNPRGNRNYYAKHMEEWAAQRDVWKARQIADTTEYSTVNYAQQRFRQMNGLRGGEYVLDGPPPVCDDCRDLYGRGVVDQVMVDQYPMPLHVNCRHTWRLLPWSVTAPPPTELWVG